MKEECRKRIIDILVNKLYIRRELINDLTCDMPLTGNPFYLRGDQMVILLFEIERNYRLISAEELVHKRFYTINKIAELLCNVKEGKQL